jgi:exodeoxyribonuclease VII large subunit
VVKAVFACRNPVISGVGHEVDVTLCDLVADVRAPTPTAAAEMVVPHKDDLLNYVLELNRRLRDTDRWYEPKVQRVDDLSLRLRSRLVAVSTEASLKVKAAESALGRIKPNRVIEFLGLKLFAFETRLSESIKRDLRDRSVKLDSLMARLEALSPQSALNRGFSVLYSRGVHIRSVADVRPGDPLEARVSDGIITGVVKNG